MRYLLDTHTFMWCFNGSRRLSNTAKSILTDADSQKYISVASLWEFSIKHSMGNFPFEGGLSELYRLIKQYNFSVLQVIQPYLTCLIDLPFIHRDPFDRLIVATAKAEGMTILTADENIHKYGVMYIW